MSDPQDPVKPDVVGFPTRREPDEFVRLTERTALFQEAVAERLGINVTDLRCFAMAYAEPGISASRLAELSGLTSGGITGVIDRLERARLVRRESDPSDRRRALVRALPDRKDEIMAVYDRIGDAIDVARARLDVHQLAGLDAFIGSAVQAFEEETARLRATTRGGMIGEMFTAPLGDASTGRLLFVSRAPRLSLRAAPLGPGSEARMVAGLAHSTLRLGGPVSVGELCRATFSGPMPDIHARDGAVAVRYKRRLDLRPREAQVSLSPEVPWSMALAGGLSELTADLTGLRLRSFDVRGGADRLELVLPPPDGTSRIRISGGAAKVVVRHPTGSAVRLKVSGGVQRLRFGPQERQQVHGELRLETPGAPAAPDRYEIELLGGVQDLRVIAA